MAGELVTNFATSALVGSTLTAVGTSFSVTASQGALFPTGNFLVTIDSEIILISSRSGDVFTIGQRGYDGTTAASHSVGATVQCSFAAQHLKHLWQNVADSYTPQVPPAYQLAGLSASVWDNEFESLGSWTLFPTSPASGSVWNINTSMRSHLVLDRAYNDNTLYNAYVAFNPPASTPYMVTTKVSHASNFVSSINTSSQLSFWFNVTDQTNPTASVGSGTRFQIKVVLENATQAVSDNDVINSTLNQPYIVQLSAHGFSNGSSLAINPVLMFSAALPLYLRLYFDGVSTWTTYIGDGFTYWALANKSPLTFTPQTIALQFNTTASIAGTHVVDYVRVVTGSGINPRLA